MQTESITGASDVGVGKVARRGPETPGGSSMRQRTSAAPEPGLRARLDSMHQVDWQKRADVLTV